MISGRNGHRLAKAGATTLVAGLLLAGCGGDGDNSTPGVTGDGSSGADGPVVAQVGDQPITRAQFDRALRARLNGVSPLTPTSSAVVVLDPPRYERCIAALGRQLRSSDVSAVPPRKALKANCAAQATQARTQVLSTLIQQAWIAQQAKEANVHAPAGAVASQLAGAQKLAGFERRLKRSGLTLSDVRAGITAQVLTTALVQHASAAKAPTAAQARRFLRDHPELFGTAPRQTLDLVPTANAAQAQRAKAALKKGEDVQAVITGFGVQGAARRGRVRVTQGDGQLAPALQKAVSAARRGAIVGPVEVGGVFYVAAVRSTRPAEVPPYAKVTDKVNQLYLSYQAQNAQIAFQQALSKAWLGKTTCAKGYAAPECGNAPGGSSTTTTGG